MKLILQNGIGIIILQYSTQMNHINDKTSTISSDTAPYLWSARLIWQVRLNVSIHWSLRDDSKSALPVDEKWQ